MMRFFKNLIIKYSRRNSPHFNKKIKRGKVCQKAGGNNYYVEGNMTANTSYTYSDKKYS